MGIFSKKKPTPSKSAQKPAAKPKAKPTPKNNDDAAAVVARLKQRQAENPDDCPFC